jgi:hypothetical protein
MDLPVIPVGTSQDEMVDRCCGCGMWRLIYRTCSACGRAATAQVAGSAARRTA